MGLVFFFFKVRLNSLVNFECEEQEVSPLREAEGGLIESKRKLLPGGVSIHTLSPHPHPLSRDFSRAGWTGLRSL